MANQTVPPVPPALPPQMPKMPQQAPVMGQSPSKDPNGQDFYTLLNGEQIIFELKIDQASRSGFDVSSMVSLGGLKAMISNILSEVPIIGHFFDDKRIGVFAVTNMRCLVSQVTVSGCSHREVQRTFWAFPRSAMNQSVGYEKTYEKKCLCCTVEKYELEVGLTIGNESESLKVDVCADELASDAEALSLCAKIAELGEHANK